MPSKEERQAEFEAMEAERAAVEEQLAAREAEKMVCVPKCARARRGAAVWPARADVDPPAVRHAPRAAARSPFCSQADGGDIDALLSSVHGLDLTSEDLDFDEKAIEEEILQFSSDAQVKAALEEGVDLRVYGRQVEGELRNVERASIKDYVAQSNELAGLHYQIHECDNTLESMENLLCGFQEHLANISNEIRHLQDRSLSMNVKVKNRKAVEGRLGAFVEDIIVPPDLVDNICMAPVDEAYLEYLSILARKMAFVSGDGATPGDGFVSATRDIEPELRRLQTKAVQRVREFLLQRIQTLKRPKTNVQILQHSVLLKFRYFEEFLVTAAPDVAREVMMTYAATVQKIFHSHLKTYVSDLMKLHQDVASKDDVLVAEENKVKGLFSSRAGPKSDANVFALGSRATLLDRMDAEAIVAHAASQKGHKFNFEAIFRSMLFLLVDTATSEYLFTLDFFGSRELFQDIFSRILQLYVETVEAYLFNCYDTIGVLLCVRITHHFQLVMSRRRVPCLDSFFDRLLMLFWPKFKTAFDLNVDSIRKVNIKSAFSRELTPHAIVRKYALYAGSIMALNLAYDDEIITSNLGRLRGVIDNVLTSLAALHGSPRDRTIFLINNYDMILTTFAEHSAVSPSNIAGSLSAASPGGPAATAAGDAGDAGDGDGPSGAVATTGDFQFFTEQMNEQISTYVETELRECNNGSFAKLVSFVKETEPHVSTMSSDDLRARIDLPSLEAIVQSFAKHWKSGIIESIHKNIQSSFSNMTNGMEILKRALTQMLLYYTRFLDVIAHAFKKNPPFKQDIVSIQQVMYEIKARGRR